MFQNRDRELPNTDIFSDEDIQTLDTEVAYLQERLKSILCQILLFIKKKNDEFELQKVILQSVETSRYPK